MSRGVVDTRDLIYFGSVIGVFLLFTKTKLESSKLWNQIHDLNIKLNANTFFRFVPIWCYTYLDIQQKKDVMSFALNYCVPTSEDKILLTRSNESAYSFVSEADLSMRT